MELDTFFPQWDFRERHRTRAAGGSAAVLRATETVTWSEVPAFRLLLAVRMLGRNPKGGAEPIVDGFLGGSYEVVARTDAELVIGAIMRASGGKDNTPVVAATGAAFRDFTEPGYVKIAYNFLHSGETLSTETRVLCTDSASRAAFRLYWTAIRVPSGLVRREWLAAIRRRAERVA
jgi:hypothetical protein